MGCKANRACPTSGPPGATVFGNSTRPRARKFALAEKVIRRIAKILTRHQEEHSDDQVGDALAHVQAASVRSTLRPPRSANDDLIDARQPERSAFATSSIGGFSLHANVAIHQNDREGIERLCRYGLRPAFALERLSWTEDGNIRYQYKRPAPNGKHETECEPVEFLAKLAALIPPPRKHLTRYHGVFAPNHAWRNRIVPTVSSATASASSEEPAAVPEAEKRVPATELARRLDWATLLMRVFAMDVLECPKCDGRMRVLAFITEPDVIERNLTHLDLPTEPPCFSRSPPPSCRAAG
ncbi:MAG: hypothetical protein GY769_10070 [bacterium]|nr:hypothetical protein [bacterium]